MAKRITPEMDKLNDTLARANARRASTSYWADAWRRLRKSPTAMIGMVVLCLIILSAVFANILAPYDYYEADYSSLCAPPSAEHLFGTDNLGRDMLSRCLYGGRWTLSIGFASMIFSLATGGVLGLLAAFFGSRVDNIIMRFIDVLQAIPSTLMAITVVATLGSGLPQLFVALALSSMPMVSKAVRASVLTVRDSDYIESSRAIGVGNIRLMFRHMLPNAMGYIIIYAVGSMAGGIMVVAMLSYIGLGIQPPYPEWGALLNAGKSYISTAPYLVIFPGLFILVTVLCLNLLGNGLRDALDPRLK